MDDFFCALWDRLFRVCRKIALKNVDPERTFERKLLTLDIAVSLFAFASCIILVAIYTLLNIRCILHPELSSGYSCGTPFGDGGDLFNLGMMFAYGISCFLPYYNVISIIISVFSRIKNEVILLMLILVLTGAFITCCILYSDAVLFFPMLVVSFMLGNLYALIFIPIGGAVALTAVLFLVRQRFFAVQVLLLLLALAQYVLLLFYTVILFLD